MNFLIIILLFVGLVGIISNQYSGLSKMDEMKKTLDDINQKLGDMNTTNNK